MNGNASTVPSCCWLVQYTKAAAENINTDEMKRIRALYLMPEELRPIPAPVCGL
jgi:hypothetical protein